MKYLSSLRVRTDCAWLDQAIFSEKDNAKLLYYLKFTLREHYRKFDAVIDDYKTAPTPSRIDLTAQVLKEFYLNPPAALRGSFKLRRADHQLDECPYCGYPSPPETLDHFIPKEKWPEFAIFSNNLVPQCRDCAPIKGHRYYCSNKRQALFLHPMYSAALSAVRFDVDITIEHEKPLFKPRFSIEKSTSEEDANRIKLHLSSLKVPKRIVAYCEHQYKRWGRLVREKGCNIKKSFETRLEEYGGHADASNWAAAFYLGVLSSPEVIESLQGDFHQKPSSFPKCTLPLMLDEDG
ncbi:hypothetical protein V2J87_26115 [Pseudomonas alliivorans]|nr:hypothetical protein [Pseudomonas alliivorans]